MLDEIEKGPSSHACDAGSSSGQGKKMYSWKFVMPKGLPLRIVPISDPDVNKRKLCASIVYSFIYLCL